MDSLAAEARRNAAGLSKASQDGVEFSHAGGLMDASFESAERNTLN